MRIRNQGQTIPHLAAVAGLIIGVSLMGPRFAYAEHPDDWHKDPGADPLVQRMADDLDLTADQQSAVRTILENERASVERRRAESRKQIDALLTDAQKARRDDRMKRQQERRLERMDDRLDLSDEQVSKIKAIFEEQRTSTELTRTQVRERIAAVLTDQQREKLQDDPRRETRKDRAARHETGDCGTRADRPQ